jgi:hypothetical protein
VRDPNRDLERVPSAPYPAGQRSAAVTARPDDHRHQIGQLTTRELDLYGSQLARCLKALGTDAPMRAEVQRELSTVRAEQESRARGGEPHGPGRPHDVSGLTSDELERTRRDLRASLALARLDSPTRMPVLAHLSAIETELAERTGGRPNGLPGSPLLP